MAASSAPPQAASAAHRCSPNDTDGTSMPDEAGLNAGELAVIGAWRRDAGLLLAERAQRRGDEAATVGLPRRLPVSSLGAPPRAPPAPALPCPAPLARPATPRAPPRLRVPP